MRSRRLVFTLSAILLAEAAAIVSLPAKIPRAVRALNAGVDVIAAVGLWTVARQKRG